jgi:hypothetical protein
MATPEQKPGPAQGKKPTGNHEGVTVAQGLEKEPSKSEVSGHGYYPNNYMCWNDHAINFVPGGIFAFYCWRCWAYNVAP